MKLRFLTKKSRFFEHFSQLSEKIVTQTQLLSQLLNNPSDHSQVAHDIETIKNDAKKISQELFTDLHKTFITPFDRHDIHNLNLELYNAINKTNSTAKRFVAYHLDNVPHEMHKLSDLCVQAARSIKIIIHSLDNLSDAKTIIDTCQEIKRLESQADQYRLSGISTALATGTDPFMLFKKNEIYELLETITDCFQRIAYLVEGILLEYA